MSLLHGDELELVAVGRQDQGTLGQAQQFLQAVPAELRGIAIPGRRQAVVEVRRGAAEVIHARPGIHGALQVADPEPIPQEPHRIEPGFAAGTAEGVDPGQCQLVAGPVGRSVGEPRRQDRVTHHRSGESLAQCQLFCADLLR